MVLLGMAQTPCQPAEAGNHVLLIDSPSIFVATGCSLWYGCVVGTETETEMKPDTTGLVAAFIARGGKVTQAATVDPRLAMESYRATTRAIREADGRVAPVRIDWTRRQRNPLSATFRGTHT